MLGLVLIVALSLAPAASAKTYDDFGEPPHSAVQYEHSDVASYLQPYVGTVDYDTVYGTGHYILQNKVDDVLFGDVQVYFRGQPILLWVLQNGIMKDPLLQ